jgi:hypothetical protein
MRRPAAGLLALALAFTSLATVARAQAVPDWNALSGEQEVSLVTHDPDGVVRDTTVWLAVVDGQGYLRTGKTHWRENLDRNPDTQFRIGGREYPLRARHVTDPELIQRIGAAFRAKYGFSDRFVGWFTSEESRYYIAMVARPPGE